MPGDDEAQNEPGSHLYGLPSLTLLVIASMIGAGIFTTSGFTLGTVGSAQRVMLCWCVGGVIAICGAVAYGRLAQLVPQSGGEYLYLSRHVHPFAGFLAGWVSLTAGFSGAIATAAVAFERYAVPDSVKPTWLPDDMIAIAVVLVGGALHGIHSPFGKHFQNGVVCVKLCALAAFLGVVVFRLPDHSWFVFTDSPKPEGGLPLVTAIATSVVWISLSYAGFNAAIYVASESAQARRVVPRALLSGTVGVTLLYLILNLIFVTSAPIAELAWQEDIAAIAAHSIGGTGLEGLVRIAVALGLLSSVLGMIMTGPRVYSRMADDGVFPSTFRASKNGIPRSIALQTGIAVGLILVQRILVETGWLSSSLLGMLIYLGTTLSLSSALCAATLFLPSVIRADFQRPRWVNVATAVYVVATLTAILLLIVSHQEEGQPRGFLHLTGALLTLISGTTAWFCFVARKKR